MYRIERDTNTISKIEEKSFQELGFKERDHLQEWLAGNPRALGEELLIIQKEFSGFKDTNERLDLLAIDKQGSLVIIENKLDDSGKDVTWQVLKYASYCSSLSKDHVRDIYQEYLDKQPNQENAAEKLSEFLDGKDYEELTINVGNTQRIIMVAGKYRKEVTSTVLWLMNFNLRVQCFKVTPFSFGEELLLNVEQILPIPDAEEFSVSMATKAQDEIATQESTKNRHLIRTEFWKQFLSSSNATNSLFSNISPSRDNWCGIGIGMSGVNLNVVATSKYCRAEIYFNRGSQEENKDLFDFAISMRSDIENSFGGELDWQRMSEKVSSRIKCQMDDVNVFDKDDWDIMIDFLVDVTQRMAGAFKTPVKRLNKYSKNKN